MPQCQIEGCAVRVNWFYPEDNGCDVDKYRLMVSGQEHTACTRRFTSDFSCLIGMHDLK